MDPDSQRPESGPPPTFAVLSLAALAGAGTMTVELAAVRLLAPWFGTSLAVWTNVIGVILLALAVGYLLGARLSGTRRPLGLLGGLLVVAALGIACLPALSAPVADWFLPENLALDEAASLVVWGSLSTSLILFLFPATLLGAVAPLAVETLQRARRSHAGDAGGRVLAASTLGSLVGVFGSTHVLVPELGLTRAFLVAALALGAAGALGLWLSRGRPAVLGWAVLPLASLVLPARPGPQVAEGWQLLAARESRYQSVRVSEDQRGPEPMRHLQVNEGFDSFQSVWQPSPGLLPEGFYYNFFALPLHWTAAERDAGSEARVLVLGLGAGTAWRVLEGITPGGWRLDLEGVELDPDVVDLAREHMDLAPADARHRVWAGLDARVALGLIREPADLILLDCYANQVEIPPHLVTVEFLTGVREALAPGGWLAANLGGFGLDDPLVHAVAATCARAFGTEVLVARVPSSRNFMLYARRDAPLPLENGRLRLPAEDQVADLLRPLEVSGSWRTVGPDEGPILTDDRAPVERLQLASIAEGRRRRAGGTP